MTSVHHLMTSNYVLYKKQWCIAVILEDNLYMFGNPKTHFIAKEEAPAATGQANKQKRKGLRQRGMLKQNKYLK